MIGALSIVIGAVLLGPLLGARRRPDPACGELHGVWTPTPNPHLYWYSFREYVRRRGSFRFKSAELITVHLDDPPPGPRPRWFRSAWHATTWQRRAMLRVAAKASRVQRS